MEQSHICSCVRHVNDVPFKRWSTGLMHWISPLGTLTLVRRQMSLIASSKYSMDICLHPQNHHAIWQEQQSVLTRRLEVLRALAVLWEEAFGCAVPGVTQHSHPPASPGISNTLLPRNTAKKTPKAERRGKMYLFGFMKWTNTGDGLNYILYQLWCIIRIVKTFSVSRKRFFPGARSKP